MVLDRWKNVQLKMEGFFNGFAAIVITFMMFLTTADVALRYVFNSPLPGVYTLCEMLMVCVVYPAAAYVQQKRGHVRVDIIIDRLHGPARAIFELATLSL